MNTRDRAIIADLQRFRALTRDDIAALHFANVKNPVNQVNSVMKRLRRDGIVDCATDRRKYVYFPKPTTIKKDSAKLGHFLAIAEFYREIRAIEEPRIFHVEPKLGAKGTAEPDVFMIWRGAPWYVEVQRSQFSDKVMRDKLARYGEYYVGATWEQEPWQPHNKRVFPYVWIVGKGAYRSIEAASLPFRLIIDGIAEVAAKTKKAPST